MPRNDSSKEPRETMRSLARTTFLVAFLTALVGVAWWVIGFLPWVLAGFRWAQASAVGASSSSAGLYGVRMPLPLITDKIGLLVWCALLGGVLAGLTPILFTRLNRRFAVFWVFVVVTAMMLITAYDSARVVRSAARSEFAGDRRVLTGLCVVLVLAALTGLVAGLVSVLRHGFVAVAAGLVAAALVVWLPGLTPDRTHPLFGAASTHLIVAAVLGIGLAVSVHRTVWSALWWPFALAMAWSGVPAGAALSYLGGQLRPASGLSGGRLPDVLDGTRQVFVHAWDAVDQPVWPLVVAVLIGAVGLVGYAVRRRRHPVEPDDEPDAWGSPWRDDDEEPDATSSNG